MNDLQKKIALLCNPTHENEKALRVTHEVVGILQSLGIAHAAYTTYWPPTLLGFTEAWVIGGDGTVNFFINQYKDLHIPFAVFAGGTGNDFHWMMYGNSSLKQQVSDVLRASARQIDAGICNGQLFLNGVGIGFDGAIVKDLLGKKKLAGKASYMLSILKNIAAYHEVFYRIEVGGELIEQPCLLISVANARRYGGGFHVAPRAEVADGLLDINIVGRISPLKRIRYLPVIEKGEHLDLPFVTYRQQPMVRITAAQPVPTHIDGEFISSAVFEIQLLPERFSLLY